MMRYNPEIHHRHSIRLQGYDYSKDGLYFITICTNERRWHFGEIAAGAGDYPPRSAGTRNFGPSRFQLIKRMVLNDGGKMADECWRQIPNHYPNVILHAYVVMPNHVHGIIEIKTNPIVGVENFQPMVGVQHFDPPHHPKRNAFQKIIPRSVGSIVRGFKTGVTNWFHQNTDIDIVWERNYYEHIIRDAKAYNNITRYIINNPNNWNEDKFYHA